MKRTPVNAFSLLEVTIALGLLALSGFAILSLLLGGVRQTALVRDDTMTLLLARQVRTRLLDPQWPGQREVEAGRWKATVGFDANGVLLETANLAAWRVEMQAGPGLGFDSPRLETVRARILRQKTEVDSFVLQRVTEVAP